MAPIPLGIIGAAIVMVAAVAGWQAWNAYQTASAMRKGRNLPPQRCR